LPTYAAGDSFLFTKGRWEQVLAVGDGKVVWAGPGDTRIERTPNFILTTARWRSVPSRQAAKVGGPDSLWPLRVGATAEFFEIDEDGERRWKCKVTGTREAEIPAGTFDVFRVRCTSGTKPGPVYERVWYFAPEVGHYVVYLFKRDGRVRLRSELLAEVPDLSRLDAATQAAVNEGFQEALEQNVSGRESLVTRNGVGPIAAVVPLATFRGGDRAFCRTYRLAMLEASRERTYSGFACRTADGLWRIPSG
jgi:hypothetical protein